MGVGATMVTIGAMTRSIDATTKSVGATTVVVGATTRSVDATTVVIVATTVVVEATTVVVVATMTVIDDLITSRNGPIVSGDSCAAALQPPPVGLFQDPGIMDGPHPPETRPIHLLGPAGVTRLRPYCCGSPKFVWIGSANRRTLTPHYSLW